MKIYTAAALIAALSGCATQFTPTENFQSTSNVIVNLPPEKTYQNLVRAARENCFPMTVEAQFYQNTQQGDVSFATYFDTLNSIVWAKYAIVPSGVDSAVTISSPGKVKEFFAPSVEWMNGRAAKCPIDRR